MRGDILRLMMALSIQDSELVAEQMDVVTAFLNAHLTENIYMSSRKALYQGLISLSSYDPCMG